MQGGSGKGQAPCNKKASSHSISQLIVGQMGQKGKRQEIKDA
ncbi:hypothetical protein SD77_4291 [Bacillus badius]|uniref:Ribose 5-phosphate isomerase B n=1 Tax=Bacillus badius TaxID=1455 RepID=A0ABR5AV37_BACBA|nr:hypothetical protein SD77_4291 [Bacillus badius]